LLERKSEEYSEAGERRKKKMRPYKPSRPGVRERTCQKPSFRKSGCEKKKGGIEKHEKGDILQHQEGLP